MVKHKRTSGHPEHRKRTRKPYPVMLVLNTPLGFFKNKEEAMKAAELFRDRESEYKKEYRTDVKHEDSWLTHARVGTIPKKQRI